MASPVVLDFERLLAPIVGDLPSGLELRDNPESSPLFHQIKAASESARNAEKLLLRASMAPTDEEETKEEPPRPDWDTVFEQASEILANKSKDLWIAAWLIEALARLHGFAGLRDGFHLTRELCEQYWEGIHPLPDDETIEWTVSQLAGLNGEDGDGALIVPIDAIPITPETRSYPPLTSLDHIEAVNLSTSSDANLRAAKIEQGVPTLEVFDKVVADASRDDFANLLDDIREAREEFDRLTEVLDERCGKDDSGFPLSPPSSTIAKALAKVQERVQQLTGNMFGEPDAGEGSEAAGDNAAADSAATGGGGADLSGAVQNREDAFRALLKISDFFHRTEPHSPVSYALEQAVRWGRMPLPELMKDLIENKDVRQAMFRRAGIPNPDDGD